MSNIYIARHEESLANADPSVYDIMFDMEIPLSHNGSKNASKTAEKIKEDILSQSSVDKSKYNDPKGGTQVHCSPYARCVQSAEIYSEAIGCQKITKNLFLIERQYGERNGAYDVDNLNSAPMEKYAFKKTGILTYTPVRGESLVDVQMRVALFVLQHDLFRLISNVVIVSHAYTCAMFHSYFTGELPTLGELWRNGEVRKYTNNAECHKFNLEKNL